MPCSPNDVSLNIPVVPGPSIPGFGIPFSPIQLPVSDFQWPEGFPQNLLDIIDKLGTLFHGIKFEPQLDDITNNLLKGISDVLKQLAPFLALYKFFQALLNMVLCVLEVLCAFKNPRKMYKAMKRLFKHCLPPFLALFPWLALLAMIIALLLLLLALLEYIIQRMLALINEILKNLKVYADALSLKNDDAILAAAEKIAQLMCLIENLLAVLVAVAAVISIIEALAGIKGRSACATGATAFGDNVDCCDDDVCPPFIRNNPDGIAGTNGSLIYHKQVGIDVLTLLGLQPTVLTLPPIRAERWQFINNDYVQQYKFVDMITPVGEDDNIFFPEQEYTSTTLPKKAPYTVDMQIKNFDPHVFHSSDMGGSRDFTIKGCIVYKKPIVGYYNAQNAINNSNTTGTMFLVGGLVTESNGTPYLVGGQQATLETFIHEDAYISSGGLPQFEDGYFIKDISYTWNINHPVLMDLSLITLGCLPDVAVEKAAANLRVASVGFDSIINRVGPLPDVLATHICATNAVSKFRGNVTASSAADFQSEVTSCLASLQNDVSSYINRLILAGVSVYESTMSIDIDLQFTSRKIKIDVVLNDAGGNSLINNLPSDLASQIGEKIEGHATLGSVSKFAYDGYGVYNGYISSDSAGDGYLTMSFDGSLFQKTLNADSDVPTAFEINTLNYTFITSATPDLGPAVRRDPGDVSNNNTG